MNSVSRGIDRIEVIFDEPNLVANAGLLLVATLVVRLGLERLINASVDLSGRVGGALPGRKVLTLVHAMTAGGSHIDHADMLRSGATASVLGHRVMAPSTLGIFLRSFTFGHIRQLDHVLGEALRRAWALGAGPGPEPLVLDLDSTICEVCAYCPHPVLLHPRPPGQPFGTADTACSARMAVGGHLRTRPLPPACPAARSRVVHPLAAGAPQTTTRRR